jgi:hypothetical protein
MKVVYARWHNNYEELTLGKTYEAIRYKVGWLLIGAVLFREESFDKLTKSEG